MTSTSFFIIVSWESKLCTGTGFSQTQRESVSFFELKLRRHAKSFFLNCINTQANLDSVEGMNKSKHGSLEGRVCESEEDIFSSQLPTPYSLCQEKVRLIRNTTVISLPKHFLVPLQVLLHRWKYVALSTIHIHTVYICSLNNSIYQILTDCHLFVELPSLVYTTCTCWSEATT